MITLTEAAANKIKSLFESQNALRNVPEENKNFRIKVVSGGCSGFQYQLTFDSVKNGDQVFEHFGVKVICDPKSYLYVVGSEIDYSDNLMDAGFKIKNPNAKGGCGCGSSFDA